MRSLAIVFSAFLAGNCSLPSATASAGPDPRLSMAEALIDAFYSFDPVRLRSAMNSAPASRARLLYYQGWAEGGNYQVVQRSPCRVEGPEEVTCAITVKDDFIAVLRTGYDVTDKFHITFEGQRIVAVRNSSNDPPQFEEALKWLGRERPEILDGPCRGFFEDGPTPKECARAAVKGFADFLTARRSAP